MATKTPILILNIILVVLSATLLVEEIKGNFELFGGFRWVGDEFYSNLISSIFFVFGIISIGTQNRLEKLYANDLTGILLKLANGFHGKFLIALGLIFLFPVLKEFKFIFFEIESTEEKTFYAIMSIIHLYFILLGILTVRQIFVKSKTGTYERAPDL